MKETEFEKTGPVQERKDKTATTVRNVVFGIALFIAALSIVALLMNFFELALYRPISYDRLKDEQIEAWKAYQSMVCGFSMFGAVLVIAGVIFAVIALKIKKLRFAAMIAFAAIAVLLFILAIVTASSAFYYIYDEMDSVTVPEYISTTRGNAAVALSSGFAASALQPCVCFAAMAACMLTMFLADRKERREGKQVQEPVREPAQESPALNHDTPVAKQTRCPDCGTPLAEGAAFCIYCGRKIDGNS